MFSNLFRSDVGLLSNTGVDCSLCNEFSNSWSNTWIEWRWDNVFCIAFFIGNQRSDCFCSSDLHLFIDLGSMNVQSTTEKTWECENVVNLVWIVGTTGTNNSSASFFCQSRIDFWSWVSASKDDWFVSHGFDHILSENARSRNTNEYVCTFDNVSQRTGEFLSIGDLGHFNFNIVEAIASFVDCTLAVAEDCICNTCGEQQFGDSDSSSASTAYNNVEIFDVFANNFQSVEQTCQSNDSSTMLVIVEDWNVADLFEFVFDVEAFWSFDVFEVYTAEGWFHQFNGFNDLVRIHGVQTDWESVNACKGFEQNSFTFHNRQTSASADVAKAQNSSTVCYNSNHVAFCSIIVDCIVVFIDFEAWLSNAWRISKRKVFCTVERNFALYAQFTMCFFVQFKRFFINVHFGNPP